MDGKEKQDGVLESYSPATSFEVRLNEVQQRSTKCPSSQRAMSIFEVFDEVLPQLGIFRKILKMVRDEMFEAVYSHQYTGSQEQHTDYSAATNVVTARGVENKVYIERIPYFSLVQRVYDSRHEEADELREEVKVLQKRLSDKTMQFNQAVTTIGVLRDDILGLQATVEEKEEMIDDRDDTIASKEDEIITLKEEAFREKTQLEMEKHQLEEEVAKLKSEVEYLSHYKKGYDDLEEAFIFRPGEDKFTHAPKKSRKSAIATKKNHLLTDYEAAKKIEKQLLLVRNQTIEEFDAFFESHVMELKDRVFKDKPREDQILPDHIYDQEELIIEKLDMQLGDMQVRFQQTIDALNNELEMIRLHKDYVETQLDELDKHIRAGAKPPSRVMFRSTGTNLNSAGARSNHSAYGKQSRLSGKESTMSVRGGGDSFESMDFMGAEMDPFIPQEAILSKYSVMVYTSTNQKKTFHGLKDAKFCASCGEKTVICPHKVSSEKIIILPHNCSHIKLSRPRVRIQSERKDKEYRKPHPPKSKKGGPQSGTTDASGIRKSKQRTSQDTGTQEGEEQQEMERPEVTIRLPVDDQTDEGAAGEEEGEKEEDGEKEEGDEEEEEEEEGEEKKKAAAQEQQEKPFTVLWDDYKERTGQTRHVPRPLELRRVMSMISQFYSYVMLQDDTAGTPAVSILEALYTHFEERYLIREVSYLCMHDFIQGVIEYAPQHKFIQIFAHVMVGNLDATVFRYLLILTDLVDRVDWHHIEDFKYFIMAVYPFLNEDELDQLHLGYTSFSENKVTKTLIFEYFMYIILKYREPRFQDVEMKMAQRPGREFGVMSEREFNEAADALAPLANEGLRNRLFRESLEHFSKDGRVAISRLTYIVSYLLLYGMAPLLREKISETMQGFRLDSADTQSRTNQSRGGMQSRGTNLSRTGHSTERPVTMATMSGNQEKSDEPQIITASQLKNLAKNVERRSLNRGMRQIQANPRMDIDDMLGDGEAFDELAEFSNSGLLMIGPD
ncbi:neurofilament medium polypeptide isoform X2 [Strongylocentrotus purpuratus]|uniref:Uncharacterized protein n=1 Tax=Strongylocentrotus purpuratus TaxID=7668 RepID=A0A7M7SZ64_STRPU|nr:neurofilament medium polypeptide isoform X1 [Strongylocentrotus purpuratus]XP_030842137.1 neurofilament medium polypeptide isoform X2 [Strongylocentrotus purpuratus]